MKHIHHVLDYVEINVQDMDRVRAFYGDAFGWRFNDYGPDYSGIQTPDGDDEIGGLAAGGSPGAGGVTVLLYSDDLDASVKAVEGAGGTIAEGPYDYPGGRRFIFTDPDGNRLGVYQPSDG